jgi:hypothetical protein
MCGNTFAEVVHNDSEGVEGWQWTMGGVGCIPRGTTVFLAYISPSVPSCALLCKQLFSPHLSSPLNPKNPGVPPVEERRDRLPVTIGGARVIVGR